MESEAVAVETIIPVHRGDRPLLRAVDSVLDGLNASNRVTIVCHNLAPEDLDDYNELTKLPTVRFLTCSDGERSPAGPRNLALERANATWVCLIDSDDYVEPGAVQRWIEAGEEAQADAVIPRHERSSGRVVRTPVKRPRATLLDPVKDRLAYRVGHLGLVRLAALRELGLKYSEGLQTGEDLAFSMPLWFSGRPVIYGADLPSYVVNDQGADHVTAARQPAADQLEGVRQLLASSFYKNLSANERLNLNVKLLRGEVLTLARQLAKDPTADPGETREVAGFLRDVVGANPKGKESPLRFLSVADAQLVRQILRRARNSEPLRAGDAHRNLFSMVLPDNIRSLFLKEGPVRFALASALVR